MNGGADRGAPQDSPGDLGAGKGPIGEKIDSQLPLPLQGENAGGAEGETGFGKKQPFGGRQTGRVPAMELFADAQAGSGGGQDESPRISVVPLLVGSNNLFQGGEECVHIRVGADTDPEAVGHAAASEIADKHFAFAKAVENDLGLFGAGQAD